MKLILAIVAASLAIIGNVPYLIDIFKGRVKPHPYSWFIWSIVSGTVLVGQITKGAGFASIAFIASESFTFLIFLFSLKYGFKDIPKHDKYFLVAALLGLLPWVFTKDPTISVVIMVCIDVIAFIPSLKKASRHPKTETPVLYTTNVLRHILSLLALSHYNIATMFHSVVMIITNTSMVTLIEKGKLKKLLK